MKKILTILLCVMMIVSLVPTTDFYQEENTAYAGTDTDYLCFTASGDVTVQLQKINTAAANLSALKAELKYSTDTDNWYTYEWGSTVNSGTYYNRLSQSSSICYYATGTEISLNNGDKVYFSTAATNTSFSQADNIYYNFKLGGSGTVAASGNIMSLIYPDISTATNASATEIPCSHCFSHLFLNCTSLTSAPALPATTLKESCYSSMFYNCTALTTAPALPATTLIDYCYQAMFMFCTSLTYSPALPATTLAPGCYRSMFHTCSSLKITTTSNVNAATILNIAPETSTFTSWNSSMFMNTGDNINYPEIGQTYYVLIPVVDVGEQEGALTYGTASSTTYSVTAPYFTTEASKLPATYKILWKDGDTWTESATPTGVSASFNASKTTLTISTSSKTNAGTYKFKVQASTKYITKESGETSLTISPKNLTVSATVNGKTYDGTDKAVIGTIETLSNAVPGDDVYIATATGTFATKNAGNGINVTIKYTLGGTAAANYTIEDSTTVADIGRRTVTLTSASAYKIYDGTPLEEKAMEVGGDGFAGTEGATYAYTGSQTNVGTSSNTFTFVLSDASETNYDIETVEGILTVYASLSDVKDAAKTDIDSQAVTSNAAIDAMAYLSADEKTNYKKQVAAAQSAAKNYIDAATTTNGVDSAKATGIANINAEVKKAADANLRNEQSPSYDYDYDYDYTQKPTVTADNSVEYKLSSDGSKVTITVKEGYELKDVLVNGVSKGAVTELTGLKTGDKIEIVTQEIVTEDPKPTVKEIKTAVSKVESNARSKYVKKNGKKYVQVTFNLLDGNEELQALVDQGCTTKYVFYRSTSKKLGTYKKMFTSSSPKYTNTKGVNGKTYYYRAILQVYQDGKLVASTKLSDCRYAVRKYNTEG